MIANVLSIAGSDPSGGAGVQADLKTFSALGCYGMAVITALTAQNTQGVGGIYPVAPDFIAQQIDLILRDIRTDAVKIGMAGDEHTIKAIAETLKDQDMPIVLDPVMVAASGDVLLERGAVAALEKHLIPLAGVITPNLPEAEVLLGTDVEDPLAAADALYQKYGVPVLLKGGHGGGEVLLDILFSKNGPETFEAPRLHTKNTHGTGCTLSSAIACFLAKKFAISDAVGEAKFYITEALAHADALDIGQGAGPVHHFYRAWNDE